MGASVIVTGVTGFLGKVVLEELLRCRDILGIATITVLIRPTGTRTAHERFRIEVATSLCFSRLPKAWQSYVQIVECNLSQHLCGIVPTLYREICSQTTHIVHCAGSVAFSSTTKETVEENIVAALKMLDMAQQCPRLQRFVSTSTAYVSPPSIYPKQEELVPLPAPARILYELLRSGKRDAQQMVKSTGHPNLYTLSKCLAEHLLVERRKNIPLVIVRPSIISASLENPFPGWIDSFAALAGLIAGAGAGVLRVLRADPEVVMDVVPVDIVARRLIEEALTPKGTTHMPNIVHVVSTVDHGIKIADAHSAVLGYFTKSCLLRKPKVKLIKRNNELYFHFYDTFQHRLPQGLTKALAILRGDSKTVRQIGRARLIQLHANEKFATFTHNTYDFRCSCRSVGDNFRSEQYVLGICRGVQLYLLQRNRSQAR